MRERKNLFLFLCITAFLLALFEFHVFGQATVVTNPADGLTNTVVTNATTVVQNLTPSASVTSCGMCAASIRHGSHSTASPTVSTIRAIAGRAVRSPTR